jgi:hypothetical protein
MDNEILYSNCKYLDQYSYQNVYIDQKVKALEMKIMTYIDIYNIKYTKIYEDSDDYSNNNTDKDNNTYNPIIKYTIIKLERIGNIEILYKNFNNKNKIINKRLIYFIHKINILVIIETLQYIMNIKGKYFDFNLYSYELFNVIGVNNINVIQQKNKNLNYNFTGSCIMLIFIRDKLFIHYY